MIIIVMTILLMLVIDTMQRQLMLYGGSVCDSNSGLSWTKCLLR